MHGAFIYTKFLWNLYVPKIQRALILATIIESEVKDVVLFIKVIILKSNTAHTHTHTTM